MVIFLNHNSCCLGKISRTAGRCPVGGLVRSIPELCAHDVCPHRGRQRVIVGLLHCLSDSIAALCVRHHTWSAGRRHHGMKCVPNRFQRVSHPASPASENVPEMVPVGAAPSPMSTVSGCARLNYSHRSSIPCECFIVILRLVFGVMGLCLNFIITSRKALSSSSHSMKSTIAVRPADLRCCNHQDKFRFQQTHNPLEGPYPCTTATMVTTHVATRAHGHRCQLPIPPPPGPCCHRCPAPHNTESSPGQFCAIIIRNKNHIITTRCQYN